MIIVHYWLLYRSNKVQSLSILDVKTIIGTSITAELN